MGALEPLPLPFKVWLQRALQIDSKTPFSSAPEAWAELDRVLHYSDPIAEIEALKVFLSRYHAAVGTADPLQAPTRQPPPAAVMPSPVSPKPSPVTAAAVPSPLTQAAPAHTPMPTSNHASPSPSSQASTPPRAGLCFAARCVINGAAANEAGRRGRQLRVLGEVHEDSR